MKLELIKQIKPEVWDKEIVNYDTKLLFHQSAWLNFLEETQHGKIMRFEIIDDEKVEGYFVGLLIRKGFMNILGSPLEGWNTIYMGPIVNKGFDQEKFLFALDETCRQLNIHYVELSNPFLDKDILKKRGFSVLEKITYIVSLSFDENEMWKKLHPKSCRKRIRQAKSNGLTIDENYDDTNFIDEYYQQLQEVFSKHRLAPPYNKERILSLCRHLGTGNCFTHKVKNSQKTLATAITIYDDRCSYIFGSASWQRFQYLRPNELLYWSIMLRASKLGIKECNLYGDGDYKAKYGAQKVTYNRYFKSYSIFAKLGREAYKFIFRTIQKLNGIFLRRAS